MTNQFGKCTSAEMAGLDVVMIEQASCLLGSSSTLEEEVSLSAMRTFSPPEKGGFGFNDVQPLK